MITLAKWRQIADILAGQIAAGELAPGDPLPSEMDVAARFGVARMTARSALQHLERTGAALPGRPRRVAGREVLRVHIARLPAYASPGESPTLGADGWLGDMLAAGREPSQDLQVITERASPAVAARLGVEAGGPVVARRLLRRVNGKPDNLIVFWFPSAVAENTPVGGAADITEGSIAWLETIKGHLGHEVTITARMPSEAEQAELAIPPGNPVLVVWRTSRRDRVPLVTSMAVHPADRTELAAGWESGTTVTPG